MRTLLLISLFFVGSLASAHTRCYELSTGTYFPKTPYMLCINDHSDSFSEVTYRTGIPPKQVGPAQDYRLVKRVPGNSVNQDYYRAVIGGSGITFDGNFESGGTYSEYGKVTIGKRTYNYRGGN